MKAFATSNFATDYEDDRRVGDGSTHDHRLRPWREVASEFTRRTGQPMTTSNAFEIYKRALRKLRKAASSRAIRLT